LPKHDEQADGTVVPLFQAKPLFGTDDADAVAVASLGLFKALTKLDLTPALRADLEQMNKILKKWK
jgi:hypothetical protein